MNRRVDPEILDSLPIEDPEAVRSRRDLRRINWLMGNHRWLARQIRKLIQPGWRVLELGAGDGTFGRRLVKRRIVPAAALTGLDLAPRPADWPAEAQWSRQDVLAGELPAAEILVANLFLHHFEPEELARLGAAIPPSCRVILCSEPARRIIHLLQSRVLALGPISKVTRHDMPVSIRAGFLAKELPEFLGISDWKISVSTTFFGAYRLVATRN